jgi:hypothetical protein
LEVSANLTFFYCLKQQRAAVTTIFIPPVARGLHLLDVFEMAHLER